MKYSVIIIPNDSALPISEMSFSTELERSDYLDMMRKTENKHIANSNIILSEDKGVK